MTIANEISKLNTNLTNSYMACSNKGATMPTDQNFDNLATCISSISGSGLLESIIDDVVAGNNPVDTTDLEDVESDLADIIPYDETQALTITPSTSQQTITAPYNVGGYTPITVNAVTNSIDSNITAANIKKDVTILGVTGSYEGSGGGGIPREVSQSGIYQMPASSFTFSLPSNAIDVGNYALQQVFRACIGLTGVDLSNLTSLSGTDSLYYAFYNCTNLTGSLDLSNLTTVTGDYSLYYAFYGTGLTSVDLSNLTTVSGRNAFYYTFSNCANLTGSLDLSNLTTINNSSIFYYTFESTGLTSVDLSGLGTVSTSQSFYYAFRNCKSLTSINLSALTTISGSSAFDSTFSGCSNLTNADLSGLTTINGSNGLAYTFSATGLTSVDLSSLTTIGNQGLYNTFRSCTDLTDVDLSGLTTINGTSAMNSTFYGCNNLRNVDLSGLTTIGTNTSANNYSHFANCFNGCNNLDSITFDNLEAIYCTGSNSSNYGTFANNSLITRMYFPKLQVISYGSGASSGNQNACKYVFYGCSSLMELHFSATNISAIQASPGYSTAWGRGAGNVTIYFDL